MIATPRHVGRRALLVGLTAVAALVAGCDYPSAVPTWNTSWELPADSLELPVDSLLPAAVRVSADRQAFLLSVDPVSFARSLGEVCSSCGAAQGQTVPKPAFTLEANGASRLPSDVASASLQSGSLTVRLTNGFGFDPLRPGATARGTMTLVVSSRGQVIATDTIRGTVQSFPTGTALTRQLALLAATVQDSVEVRVTLDSPAGDPVVVDTAQRLAITATVDTARVTGVLVRTAGLDVAFDDATLDVQDIDAAMRDRARDGALAFTIANGFDAEGTFDLTVATASGARIVKPGLRILAGASTLTVSFTEAEIARILDGSAVTLSLRGTVRGLNVGDVMAVTPDDVLRAAGRLRLTLATTER